MKIHTLSAYETTAEEFFDKLASWNTDLVLDARLRNTNQLSGFTKRDDLAYFVKNIQHADYVHDPKLAPASTVLERYLNGSLSWEDFFKDYHGEMVDRHMIPDFLKLYGGYNSIALVGTATKKRRSHVEILQAMVEDAVEGKPDTSVEDVIARDELKDREAAAAKRNRHRKSA